MSDVLVVLGKSSAGIKSASIVRRRDKTRTKRRPGDNAGVVQGGVGASPTYVSGGKAFRATDGIDVDLFRRVYPTGAKKLPFWALLGSLSSLKQTLKPLLSSYHNVLVRLRFVRSKFDPTFNQRDRLQREQKLYH